MIFEARVAGVAVVVSIARPLTSLQPLLKNYAFQNHVHPAVAEFSFPGTVVVVGRVFAEGKYLHHFGRERVINQALHHGAGTILGEAEVIGAVANVVGMALNFDFVGFQIRDLVEKFL